MRIAPLIAACFLAACATPEEMEAQRQAQIQQDVETCRGYGFRPNSDGFRNCMLQLDIARQQRQYYNRDHYYGGYYGYRHPGAGIGYYIGR